MEILTTKQMAEILGVVPRRVRALAQARGVGRKVGGQWLFSQGDIERLRPGRVGRPRKNVTPDM